MLKARKGTPQYEEWLRKYREKRKASTVKEEAVDAIQKKKFSFNDIFASLGNFPQRENMEKSGKPQQRYSCWLLSYLSKRSKVI